MNWLFRQFQLKPGKPAIASSIRALISVLVPLGIGLWTGHPVDSAIAILGAWFVGLVNVEGVYRQQATAKIVALVSITAMLLIANLVHGKLWLSALATFLVMFIAAFVGLFGQAASAIGLTTSITFIVALAKFATSPDWATVLQQCALCLAGGLWSIALSFSFWPFRPYKPVIQSVASCYGASSQLMDRATGRVVHLDDRRNQLDRFLQAQDNFTQTLTTARNRWTAAWTAQQAANLAGNQLLILVENTPAIANLVVALVEQVVITSDHPLFQQSQFAIQPVMEQFVDVLQQMARAIANGKSSIHLAALDQAIAALEHQQQVLHQSMNDRLRHLDEDAALTSLNKIRKTLARLSDQIHADVELIRDLQQGNGRTALESVRRKVPFPTSAAKTPIVATLLDPLRNNLTIHSVLFRHALRLAIVATIAELLTAILHIPRGYWITLTAVVALKPNYGGTSQTAVQRVIATTLGGLIGIAIVTLFHNPWLNGGCLLLLIMAAVAVRPLSFNLFTALLTPAIILLLNVTNQGGWGIGVLRIVDSFVGGILALLGSYLLFPKWERQQLPAQLETTLRANLAYFQQVIAAYLHPNADLTETIAPLRRQAALENSNMATAAQRLFSEPRHVQGDVEPITTLMFYGRRFFNSVTALAEHRQELRPVYQCPEFKQFADTIVQILENAADAFQQGTLQPLPNLDRSLEAMHHHLEQWFAEDQANPNPSTNRSRTIQDYRTLAASLDQIAQEIRNIHGAIALLVQVNFH